MADSIISMTVATVKLGLSELEGLIDENSRFYIAVQQAAILFSVPQNNAQRDFKALLGAGFQFVKISAKRAERQNRPENALSILDFEKLIFEMTLKGNKVAISLTRELIGLSLIQLFSDAFKIKFDEIDRQNYLTDRKSTVDLYHALSPVIDIWYNRTKADRSQPLETYRINTFNSINLGLFGKKSSAIKKELNIDCDEMIRDYFAPRSIKTYFASAIYCS